MELGFYGFGLYISFGGLGKAATGALRALLDLLHSQICKVVLS